MDSLKAEAWTVFMTVATGDSSKIKQAMDNYKEPGITSYNPRASIFARKDRDGRNLLHYACMYNTDYVATWMLSVTDNNEKYIPIVRDMFGASAVMYAARAGMLQFIKIWITQGQSIKDLDKNGMGILYYCCGAGENIQYHPGMKPKCLNDYQNKAETMKFLFSTDEKFFYAQHKNHRISAG